MSNRSKITKDNYLRKKINKNNYIQLIKKYKLQNQKFFFIQKFIFIYKLPLLVFKTRISNYCLITGTTKSVLKKFKISRISFRKLVQDKYILGIKKSK
jgi:small subunit ribosomal protein S14